MDESSSDEVGGAGVQEARAVALDLRSWFHLQLQIIMEVDFAWSGEQEIAFVVKPVPKAATNAVTRVPVAQQLVDLVGAPRLAVETVPMVRSHCRPCCTADLQDGGHQGRHGALDNEGARAVDLQAALQPAPPGHSRWCLVMAEAFNMFLTGDAIKPLAFLPCSAGCLHRSAQLHI